MEYMRVANGKILKLMMRDDCIGVTNSSNDNITLTFKNDRCTVDKWGKVIWIGKES